MHDSAGKRYLILGRGCGFGQGSRAGRRRRGRYGLDEGFNKDVGRSCFGVVGENQVEEFKVGVI